MTNKEFYRDAIFEIACRWHLLAFDEVKHKIVDCNDMDCDRCMFDGKGGCREAIREWLEEEYVEPQIDWTKVEVDTKILVRCGEDEEWDRRYFAKYENNKVYAFANGCTSWSANMVVDWKYAKLYEEE